MDCYSLDDSTLGLLNGVKHRWLVTGVAGFIGSHVAETLIRHGQQVVGLDNFATGHRRNIAAIQEAAGPEAWSRFEFREGDIRDQAACRDACDGVDIVLHQAALGSVPRSLKDPVTTNAVNIDGTLNMLIAARDAGIKRFVYAGSSSTYGDQPALPKREDRIGRPLSPYAVTKYVNELYADVFNRCYELHTIGLRYFNVFGARQDPAGPYAAVIPKWVARILRGEECIINGDGETTRDFCFVANVVQANIRAALIDSPEALGRVYNIAVGEQTSLNQLFEMICRELATLDPARTALRNARLGRTDFRPGDVRHSQADITNARTFLGYTPTHDVRAGLAAALPWYVKTSIETVIA